MDMRDVNWMRAIAHARLAFLYDKTGRHGFSLLKCVNSSLEPIRFWPVVFEPKQKVRSFLLADGVEIDLLIASVYAGVFKSSNEINQG